MLHMCVCMHSRFVENHPIRILDDKHLISKVVLSQSSTDLAEMVTHQESVSRPSHVVGRPMSLASTDFLHYHSLSLLV
jgi:hypothetical protein